MKDIELITQGVCQWIALIFATILLGDTTPHAIGIGLALYCLMPVARR